MSRGGRRGGRGSRGVLGAGGARADLREVLGDAAPSPAVAADPAADPVGESVAAAAGVAGTDAPGATVRIARGGERRSDQGDRRILAETSERRGGWMGRPGRGLLRRRRIPRLLERGLRRVTEAPLIRNNSAALLVDAQAAYPAMLELIGGAREHIEFENYIIRDDVVGRRFADALMERAQAGVAVRILYDWLGSLHTSRGFWRRLRHAGCEVRSFGAPSLGMPGRVFTRDHRKLLAVDGREAVVGGFCIGAEWEDDRGRGSWRDTAVRVTGPACLEMQRAFARTWYRAGGRLPDLMWRFQPEAAGDVAIRVIDGPPAHARTYRLYQLLAALAEHTLYVTGAYPLAPMALRRALVSAAHAGVDVRLLVPDRSDLRLLNHAARAHFSRLLRDGVRIYTWNGPMLHAKTLVVDGMLAVVGSSNLNPFSMLGCYELDLQLQDPVVAGELERQFHLDLERAHEVRLEEWKHRPAHERLEERIGAAVLWLPYKLYSG